MSPIFLLAKKGKEAKVQAVGDFFASKEIGTILAQNGLFPSTNPEVENSVPENHPFMWLGWEYIYSHDLSSEIAEANRLFNEGSAE